MWVIQYEVVLLWKPDTTHLVSKNVEYINIAYHSTLHWAWRGPDQQNSGAQSASSTNQGSGCISLQTDSKVLLGFNTHADIKSQDGHVLCWKGNRRNYIDFRRRCNKEWRHKPRLSLGRFHSMRPNKQVALILFGFQRCPKYSHSLLK